MARPGILYSEVAEAAKQLSLRGQHPTIEQVRFILGTGSSTTIANHLRQWKETQQEPQKLALKENLPEELIILMKSLWERVASEAQEQISAEQQKHQQALASIEEDLQKYKTNNQRWQHLHNQWVEEKNQLTQSKAAQEEKQQTLQAELASLAAEQALSLQQVADKQERINELQRLHRQTQENLEHYRETIREQRLLDQQQVEQQKQALQAEIRELKAQMKHLKEEASTLQENHQNLLQNYTALKLEGRQADSKITSLELALTEQLQQIQYWQQQANENQKALDKQLSQTIHSQAEVKILAQQLTDTKDRLEASSTQNKVLEQEKWSWVQEKAQLEGRLEQMHR